MEQARGTAQSPRVLCTPEESKKRMPRMMISLREFSKQVRLVIRRDCICRRLRIKFNYY